jgi:hypothetical protein
MVARFFMALWLLIVPAAALAAGSSQVFEGSRFMLFALGLLGVVVGRRASMRRPSEDREQD